MKKYTYKKRDGTLVYSNTPLNANDLLLRGWTQTFGVKTAAITHGDAVEKEIL
ncbi:MAG: hypothetical protein Q8Q08_12805 [Candidatus Omnitrophota bacterium]|nr:hypothetical protein [Candidatus Omnitrophota bacterium]